MSADLRDAHRTNDLTVAAAYGWEKFLDDESVVVVQLFFFMAKKKLKVIEVEGVRGYVDKDNVAWLNVEDIACGLGFVQVQEKFSPTSGGKTYESIRWERINGYLRELDCLGKDDADIKAGDFILEY